jgi:hypothetical protein
MSTDPFAGTWRLISAESKTASGEVSHLFGSGASGYLIYSQDGYMTASIAHANRASFASADFRAGSLEEKLAGFDTYLSYCGTYEVKGDRVVHHIELSLFPNWRGADQERFFQFSGDQLVLRTPPMPVGGVERTVQLIWQRATPR